MYKQNTPKIFSTIPCENIYLITKITETVLYPPKLTVKIRDSLPGCFMTPSLHKPIRLSGYLAWWGRVGGVVCAITILEAKLANLNWTCQKLTSNQFCLTLSSFVSSYSVKTTEEPPARAHPSGPACRDHKITRNAMKTVGNLNSSSTGWSY